MDKPTEQQWEELLKWSGCYQKHMETSDYWHAPDGTMLGFYIPFDLNNLFKYAPRRMTPELWRTILRRWVAGITGNYEKDTVALFWALYPVLKEAKSETG